MLGSQARLDFSRDAIGQEARSFDGGLALALEMAADSFGPERHCAVDPGSAPSRTSALDVAAKARRSIAAT